MAGDIQSSFKDLVGNASKEKSDFKGFFLLVLGLLVGMFLGYQLNLEKSAQIMADKDCAVCQENLGIMVSNFNVLAKNCTEAKTFRDVAILPALQVNNTIRVYS